MFYEIKTHHVTDTKGNKIYISIYTHSLSRLKRKPILFFGYQPATPLQRVQPRRFLWSDIHFFINFFIDAICDLGHDVETILHLF